MSDKRHIVQAYNMKTVQQGYRKGKKIRHRLCAHVNVAMSLNRFIKNPKGLSPVLGMMIMLATTMALSLAAVTWLRSSVYAFMVVEELQITDMHFYEGQDSAFSGLPEIHITETGQYVVIDEPSDITVSGSSNNILVVGGPHNIRLVGGYNNVTLLNPGGILIDVTNPNVLLTEVPGGWILQATHPTGRPVIRGNIYLNTLGSPDNTVYIQGGQVFQCDSSYSGSAVTVRNTGTCDVTITGVSMLRTPGAYGIPIPHTLQPNSEVTISICCTWKRGYIYTVSIFTLRGNTFFCSEIAW